MNELKLKIGDKVLITNGLPTEDKIGTVTKITPTGRIKLDIYTDYQFDRYGRQMGNRDIWSRSKSIRIPDKEDYNRVHKNEIVGHIYSKIDQLNTQNLYDTNISTLEILDDCLGLIGESKEPEYIKSNADDSKVMIMEYSNKELNEIREAGYNHGYDVGYNEGYYDSIKNIITEIEKYDVGYNEGYYDSIKNIITEIEKLSQKRCEIDLRHTKTECDKGWAAGEMNAFHMILNHIKILEQENIKTSKRVIGYDDCGKPLHEGDFCTFDVNASDWRFKPDNIRKSELATLEGQITYNEQDKCYELSIDNDYCPVLYFHAIEPGTLKLKESKEQTKEQSFRKNNKEIER